MNKEIWILDLKEDQLKKVKKEKSMIIKLSEFSAKYHKFVIFRETQNKGRIKYIGKVNFSYPSSSIYELHFSRVYTLNHNIFCDVSSKKIRRAINFEDILFKSSEKLIKSNKKNTDEYSIIEINDKVAKKLDLPLKVPLCEEDYELYKQYSTNIPIVFIIKGMMKFVLSTTLTKTNKIYKDFLINFFLNQAIDSVTKKKL